ncbi:apoptosis facilitator Bcl-2-like protein 14 isoform X2 [Engraulis encrasicolus]|uniref:apoptosis facilitator Bcl-2-like protein 14 isoform X2 n=1 Tax=Engraulis encrasicolus TaxID=184585 RepID=UPI002FD5B43B
MDPTASDTATTNGHPMENGHTGGTNGLTGDANGHTDANGDGVEQVSMEYLILMAYAQRRRPSDKRLQRQTSVATPTTPPGDDEARSPPATKEKKKGWRKLRRRILSCVHPKTSDTHTHGPAHDIAPAALEPPTDEQKAEEVADRLTALAPPTLLPGDLETDNDGDDVIQNLVKLLRESGDELNKKIQANPALVQQLQQNFSYGLFRNVVSSFLARLNLSSLPSGETQEQAKIRSTCEVVTRLSTLDTHPVSKTMGYGERYLKDYFSPWVQKQGGWTEVFPSDERDGQEEEEEEEEVQ